MASPTVQGLAAELVVVKAQAAALASAVAALEAQVKANTARLDSVDVLIPLPVPPSTAARPAR